MPLHESLLENLTISDSFSKALKIDLRGLTNNEDGVMVEEVRGVWIANLPHSRVLESPANIATSMEFLQEHGFNVVFPVIWNQGLTLFPSHRMRKEGFPEIAPHFVANFDPLEILIQEAHERDLAVVPWFEYGFAASASADGGHIIAKKSRWSALDRHGRKVIHGGLSWMNGLHFEVQDFMMDLILEVIKNYAVDGIQGDDRLPAMPIAGGYDEETLKLYRQSKGATAKPPTNEKDKDWIQWRADRLTEFLSRLFKEVKGVNRDLVVSMAPAPFPFSRDHLLQDSPAWIRKGIVDSLHPQLYRDTFSKYKFEVDRIADSSGFTQQQKAKFSPGIAFRANGVDLTDDDIVKSVNLNRQKGLQGQIFFHYEGLLARNRAIATALKTKAGYDRIASLPFKLVNA